MLGFTKMQHIYDNMRLNIAKVACFIWLYAVDDANVNSEEKILNWKHLIYYKKSWCIEYEKDDKTVDYIVVKKRIYLI